jgi:hypothetical protein
VRQRPDHAVVVEYARFFGDPSGQSLGGVLAWLGLDRGPAVDQQFTRVHEHYLRNVRPRQGALSLPDQEFVEQTADTDCWRDLVALAV